MRSSLTGITLYPFYFLSGIKNFIVNIIIKSTSDDITLRKEKTIIYKLDMVLVQVYPLSNLFFFIVQYIQEQKKRPILNFPSTFMEIIQILKQEWPHNWPSFIPEIVASSKSNLSLCENNMVILKLLRLGKDKINF